MKRTAEYSLLLALIVLLLTGCSDRLSDYITSPQASPDPDVYQGSDVTIIKTSNTPVSPIDLERERLIASGYYYRPELSATSDFDARAFIEAHRTAINIEDISSFDLAGKALVGENGQWYILEPVVWDGKSPMLPGVFYVSSNETMEEFLEEAGVTLPENPTDQYLVVEDLLNQYSTEEEP